MSFDSYSDFGYLFAGLANWFKVNILDMQISFFDLETSLGAILFWCLLGSVVLRYIRIWMDAGGFE